MDYIGAMEVYQDFDILVSQSWNYNCKNAVKNTLYNLFPVLSK